MKSEIIYDLTSEDWFLSHNDDPKVEDAWYNPNANVTLYLMKDGRWFEGNVLKSAQPRLTIATMHTNEPSNHTHTR